MPIAPFRHVSLCSGRRGDRRTKSWETVKSNVRPAAQPMIFAAKTKETTGITVFYGISLS
jgi:hypothetical protein